MATDESGEAKGAKGLLGVSQAVIFQIVASIRALYERSAPWLMLVRCDDDAYVSTFHPSPSSSFASVQY